MSIRRKTFVAFFTVIFLMLVLIVISLYGMDTVNLASKQLHQNGLRPTAVLVSLDEYTQNTRVSMLQAVMNEELSFTARAADNLEQIRLLTEEYSGFVMNEFAPKPDVFTISSSAFEVVRITTGRSVKFGFERTSAKASRPSFFGIFKSRRTRSGRGCFSASANFPRFSK